MIVYLPEVEIKTKHFYCEWITDRSYCKPDIAYSSLLEAQHSAFRTAIHSILMWRTFYKDLYVLPKIRKIEVLGGVYERRR